MSSLPLLSATFGVHPDDDSRSVRYTLRYRVTELVVLALVFAVSASVTLQSISLGVLALALPVALVSVILMSAVGAYKALSKRLCASVVARSAASLVLLTLALAIVGTELLGIAFNDRFLFFFPFLSFFVLHTIRPLVTALAESTPGDRRRRTIASADVNSESSL